MKAAEGLPLTLIILIIIVVVVGAVVIAIIYTGLVPAGESFGMGGKISAACFQWGCKKSISPSNIIVGDTTLGAICVARGETINICNVTCSCNWK